MIRRCDDRDFEVIWAIINDGAEAYRGTIPADRWTDPYMSKEKLQHEIDEGVAFWGHEDDGTLLGVMGLQQVQDVTLVRHAYVRTGSQKQGVGSRLLSHLRQLANRPVLIGTWSDAVWAIRFYERHGFEMVTTEEKNRLLKQYWSIPDRQIETSVVLADANWRKQTVKADFQEKAKGIEVPLHDPQVSKARPGPPTHVFYLWRWFTRRLFSPYPSQKRVLPKLRSGGWEDSKPRWELSGLQSLMLPWGELLVRESTASEL